MGFNLPLRFTRRIVSASAKSAKPAAARPGIIKETCELAIAADRRLVAPFVFCYNRLSLAA